MSNATFQTAIAYSTTADGSMKRKDGTVDLENIQYFLQSQQLPTNVYAMDQVHGADIGVISSNSEKIIPEVDALITNEKGLSLAVVSADCLPILFYDTQNGAAGVIHAGSKGLQRNVIANTLNKFIEVFHGKPENIFVTIGPSIEVSCYEVGSEFIKQFEQVLPWFDETFYTEAKGKYFLDLKKIAVQSLLKEGILKEHITVPDVCTKCSIDLFYSYRRGDKTERFVSTMSIL